MGEAGPATIQVAKAALDSRSSNHGVADVGGGAGRTGLFGSYAANAVWDRLVTVWHNISAVHCAGSNTTTTLAQIVVVSTAIMPGWSRK
jgi:hypothetical protein